ncbi:hypothetical protein RND81_03G018200, partial [Saponaria officinalis]
ITSLRLLSRASKQCLCIIGASSQIISFVLINSSVSSVLGFIPGHVEFSVTLIGMPNLEWAVLPPGSKIAAIPLDATGKTISPLLLIAAHNVLQIKVFPVPP